MPVGRYTYRSGFWEPSLSVVASWRGVRIKVRPSNSVGSRVKSRFVMSSVRPVPSAQCPLYRTCIVHSSCGNLAKSKKYDLAVYVIAA